MLSAEYDPLRGTQDPQDGAIEMNTTSKVYLRMSVEEGKVTGYGTYFHTSEKCGNIALSKGDVAGRVDLATIFILGRSPCPTCVKPAAILALRKSVLENLKVAAIPGSNVMEVSVDPAAAEKAMNEVQNLAQELPPPEAQDEPDEPTATTGNVDLGIDP